MSISSYPPLLLSRLSYEDLGLSSVQPLGDWFGDSPEFEALPFRAFHAHLTTARTYQSLRRYLERRELQFEGTLAHSLYPLSIEELHSVKYLGPARVSGLVNALLEAYESTYVRRSPVAGKIYPSLSRYRDLSIKVLRSGPVLERVLARLDLTTLGELSVLTLFQLQRLERARQPDNPGLIDRLTEIESGDFVPQQIEPPWNPGPVLCKGSVLRYLEVDGRLDLYITYTNYPDRRTLVTPKPGLSIAFNADNRLIFYNL